MSLFDISHRPRPRSHWARSGPPRQQRGIALLTVLMVFGLATVVVRDMMLTGLADTQGVIALRDARQAHYYALGGEAYARQLLWQDRDADITAGVDADGRRDNWFLEALTFDIDEGRLQIWVSDLQARFNLTNLRTAGGTADAAAVSQLRNLLQSLGQDPDLAAILADWEDEDMEPGPGGAEDAVYREGEAPKLAANVPLADLSELNTLAPLTESQYQNLYQHLTTLPERTKLNINTAGTDVLATVAPALPERVARALHSTQDTVTHANLAAALKPFGIAPEALGAQLSTGSSWFEVEVLAHYRGRRARLRSVVHREAATGRTRIVYRSQRSRLKAD